MTQRDRDRLVALKKAQKKLITQKKAAEELAITERQVRRLLRKLKEDGDKGIVHGLRGRPSNRKLSEEIKAKAIEILSMDVYRGFGPTLASEYLSKKHQIQIGREAVRQLMTEAGLWRPKRTKLEGHTWRERRARFGELVQWDTSEHDWLEGRGEKLYLIHMIDDATSRLLPRFVRHDSTEENMRLLEVWLRRYGRPLAFYTDKDSMFHNAPKRIDGTDVKQMPPTQIGRGLQELQIAGLRAHSAQAKGRVERSFQTAQDRLVKGMRVAGVRTIEEANQFLEQEFLPWWEAECMVKAAHPDNAHRPLGAEHNLAGILSWVEQRKVMNDHTFRFRSRRYQIEQRDILPGLRGSKIRVEHRLDGTVAACFRDRYLRFAECIEAEKANLEVRSVAKRPKKNAPHSDWMRNFNLHDAPSWREIRRSGALDRL